MSRKNKKRRMMVQVQVDEKRRKTPKKRAPKNQNTVPKVKIEDSGVVVNFYNAQVFGVNFLVIPVTAGINPEDYKDLRFKMMLEMAFPDNDIAGMRYDDEETKPESIEPDVLCDLYGYAIVPKGFVDEHVKTKEYDILLLEDTDYSCEENLQTSTLSIGSNTKDWYSSNLKEG